MTFQKESIFHSPCAALVLISYVFNILAPALAQETASSLPAVAVMDVSPAPSNPIPEAFSKPWVTPEPVKSDQNLKLQAAPAVAPVIFEDLPDDPTPEQIVKSRIFSLSPRIAEMGLKNSKERRLVALANRAMKSRGKDRNKTTIETLDSGIKGTADGHLKFAFLAEKAHNEWASGWFLNAIASWETAWSIGKTFESEMELREAEGVYANLLQAQISMGKAGRLKELITEGETRKILDGATFEALSDARQILWHLENRAEQNIFCGFTALNTICIPLGQRPAFPDVHDAEEKARFIKEGLSLFELLAHSEENGGKVRAYRKGASDEYVTPCVVHWSFGHYSALTKSRDTQYYMEDTHLKVSGWVEKEAIDSQATGIVIVPDGVEVPSTYVLLSKEETKQVFGRHCTHGVSDEGPPPPPCKEPECDAGLKGPKGMADYNFSALEPGLMLSDIPVSHNSPFGPSMDFGISYFERRNGNGEAPLPTNIGNLGPRWSHSFNTFIELRGSITQGGVPNTNVNWVLPSGHYVKYQNPSSNIYSSTYESNPTLVWIVGTDGISGRYELSFADGSKQIFNQPDSSLPSRYFLSETRDPIGNKLILNYDATLHLTSIVNDAGQSMVIGYDAEAGDAVIDDPYKYKIRSVTDPFGRVAKFKYTASGQLFRSIDTMTMVSEFAYRSGDFVSQMTTPYGTTKFESGLLANSQGMNGRYIKAIDPLGNVEYAEAFEKVGLQENSEADMLALQGGDPAGPIQVDVNGQNVSFLPKNEFLYYRNTFYWDKNAWHHGPRDYAQAKIFNWLANGDTITGVLGSTKKAGEGRVWYNYKGQSSTSSPGNGTITPTKIVRQVETAGGTTWSMQQTERNGPSTLPSRMIDALGRELVYGYTGIDLTTVKVRTGPGVSDLTTLVTLSDYSFHQPQTITQVSGLVTMLQYNSRGQVTNVTTQKGGNSETTQYVYRPLSGANVNEGYLKEIWRTDPTNASQLVKIQSFTYDSAGRVRTSLGTDSYTLTYDYDNFDRITLVTHPDGTTEQSQYDRLNLVASKNRAGEWSRTFYNALKQPAFSQDPAGRVTSYAWCLCGEIRQLIDPRGSVTRWVRDTQGRVIEKIGQDQSKTSFAYQPLSGKLANITRPNDQGSGHTTADLTYAVDGTVALVNYSDAATPDSAFSYKDSGGAPDPLGRLLSRTDPIGTSTYSYVPLTNTNGAGQLYEKNGPMADDTMRRGYDWRGMLNLTEVRSDSGTVLHSEGVSVDSLGRLTQTTNELGTFTAGYNAGNLTGNMNLWSRPNGVNTQFDWYGANDGANALALKEIHHSQGGNTVSEFDYEYDLTGNISQWTRQLDALPANAKTWTLGYSRAGELTNNIETNAGGTETERNTWNYDPAGNWYAQGTSSSTTHRTHNAMNQLKQIGGAGTTVVEGILDEPASVSVNDSPATVTSIPGTTQFKFQREIAVQQGANNFAVTATDAKGNKRVQSYSATVGAMQKSYEYDANGNLRFEKDPGGTVIRSFEWDGADRLKKVNWGSQSVTWEYNGMGQKVLETVNGAASRRFIWRGIKLLLEKNPSGTVTKRFYGDGEQRVGGTDAGNYYYTRDHLGSVREIVSQTGVLQVRYDYDAYGKRAILYQNGSYIKGCDFGYTGHLTLDSLAVGQSEIVLTHFRAYDPQLGRWLNPDPIGETGGLNLYEYVGGNPIRHVDLFGLFMGYDSWGDYYNDATQTVSGTAAGLLEGLSGGVIGMDDNILIGMTDLERTGYHIGITASIIGAFVGLKATVGPRGASGEPCPTRFPKNPSDWTPPEGWKETPAGVATGGKHRQWVDEHGTMRRRWDREGREAGKERGPHWHDLDDESGGSHHIDPDD